MTLKTLNNEELKKEFKRVYAYYKTWLNSTDGSDGACREYEVKPVIEELEKRGINYKELLNEDSKPPMSWCYIER